MRARLHPLTIVQIALVCALLPVLTLWPPISGPMMLVALPGTHDTAVMNAALAGGGVVLSAGPFAGTLVEPSAPARAIWS